MLTLLTPLLGANDDRIEQARTSISLHDTRSALSSIEQLRAENPDPVANPELLSLFFEYLAEIQDIEGLRVLWEKISSSDTASIPSATIEHIAWTNILTAARAYHPKLRAEALIAAVETEDVRGVAIIAHMLSDNHQGIQQMALQLAQGYPDEIIQKKAAQIAATAIPEVKQAAAALLAAQKAPMALAVLNRLLLDESLSEPDQVFIASKIALLSETVDQTWVEQAAADKRPAMRALAASVVRRNPTSAELTLLLPLLQDPSTTVRACAYETLGLWQSLIPEQSQQLIESWSASLQHPSVALKSVGAWALLLSNDQAAKDAASAWFKEVLTTTDDEQTLKAASRLIRSGSAGLQLASSLISTTKSPLARLNLSAYLLSHRQSLKEASEAIVESLPKTLLGTESDGLFDWISPSQCPHHPAIPRLPESEDLFIRLQLLALRRYADQPVQREEIEQMLGDRGWGISASAAAFIFQEFSGSLDEVLSPLLQHPTESVRIQSALLLTIISQSQQAATVLAEQYQTASREGKEAIILGFSRLPFEKTKKHLLPLLFDPSPVIRTRASGALLTSMYQ